MESYNPSIFATVYERGYIEILTFGYDLKTAINRLAWSCDGKKLATGDI